MSDELRLQKMLEEATAPGSGMPEGLDAETSSLREAWLALGRTLAAAEAAAGPPRELSLLAPRPARRSWSKVALFALAASLLIVASVITLRGRGPKVAEQQNGTAGTKDNATEQALAANGQSTTLMEGWEWDESIDSEIGNAARGTVWLGQDSRASSDSFSLMGQEVLEIQADINDSTF